MKDRQTYEQRTSLGARSSDPMTSMPLQATSSVRAVPSAMGLLLTGRMSLSCTTSSDGRTPTPTSSASTP